MDVLKQLGELAFASRLKRLSERLMNGVTRLYREHDVEFEARWFPLLYTLSRCSSMSVTGLARSLGLTHAAINQLATEMTAADLLISSKDPSDERRRMLSLSDKGHRTAKLLQPLWDDIRLATRQLIEGSGCDMLSALDKCEPLLDQADIHERVIQLRQSGQATRTGRQR
jgi:DNA-binding MarR family transcriptional regulator